MSIEKIGTLARLMMELRKLPGIGPRTAERLAIPLTGHRRCSQP